MHDPYWPVPFAAEALPAELLQTIAAAVADSLRCDDAMIAIREHWQDGGARSAALLLAMAYLRVKFTGEIMVDDQLAAAHEALVLIEGARGAGAPVTPGLQRFHAVCCEIRDEAQARDREHLAHAAADPSQLGRDAALDAAYALMESERPADAVPFFDRVIALEPGDALHYRWNRATCQLRSGDDAGAMRFFDQVLAGRDTGDPHIVSGAWVQRLHRTDDARFAEVFAEAVAWASARGGSFPRVHREQEALLERALALDDRAALRHLVEVVRGRRLEREVQARVDEAVARLG